MRIVWGLSTFLVGEHTHERGRWWTPTAQGQRLLCLGPFQSSPYVPLHKAVYLYPLLHNKLVNVLP